MKPKDLTALCREKIDEHPNAESGDMKDQLILSIPEPKRHNGACVRVFGSAGPYATIINGVRGNLTVYVSARRLLKFMEKHFDET